MPDVVAPTGYGVGMRKLLAPLLALAVVAAAPAAHAAVQRGPGGSEAFYTPPSKLPGKNHGDPIWIRPLTGKAVLDEARTSIRVLYRSLSVSGKPIAVSGTIALPDGTPPKGGWPVISYGHGTKGIADRCAPSRGHGVLANENALLEAWLKRGYAIVRTDYEGLGTPGLHPFLIGRSEARGMLDMVRAARAVTGSIGRSVGLAGESQGGQAALWAAADAKAYAPELNVRGVVTFAPISQLRQQGEAFPSIDAPSPNLSAYAALIMRGLEAGNPGLDIPLSDKTRALYPFVDQDCNKRLNDGDRFAQVKPSEFFREGADLAPILGVLEANDAGNLKIPYPVQIAQGTADETVFKPFTDELAKELTQNGVSLTYRVYEGAKHGNDLLGVAQVRDDALAFTKKRLGR